MHFVALLYLAFCVLLLQQFCFLKGRMFMNLKDRVYNALIEAGDYAKDLQNKSQNWVTTSDIDHVISIFELAYSQELPEEVLSIAGSNGEEVNSYCYDSMFGLVK